MAALNPDELSILWNVREHGPVTVDDVARFAHAEPSEVRCHLTALAGRGLVSVNDDTYRVVIFSDT